MKLPQTRQSVRVGQYWKHKDRGYTMLIIGKRKSRNGNECFQNIREGHDNPHSLSERDIQRFYTRVV